uniref:Sterile alpha motif domain containing 7 n=1 Tax=Crocodylus porosus TaxID=8502 RepID=A0A7M4ES50_CROPO
MLEIINPLTRVLEDVLCMSDCHFFSLLRDLLPSTEMMASADPRQIHVASHLGPSIPQPTNMPNILSNRVYPGYTFLPPESMEAVARRQELVQKQNIARMEMEMSAIFQQKEIEKAHRKGLLGLEAPFLYHGMPVSSAGFRGRHRLPDGHLPSDLYVHRTMLDDLHGNSVLVATSPYPPVSSLQRERGRRPGRRAGTHKTGDCNSNGSKSQTEDKSADSASVAADDEKEGKREAEAETPSKQEQNKAHAEPSATVAKSCKEFEPGLRKSSFPIALSIKIMEIFLFLLKGGHSLILNGDDISSVEDIRKWTVNDVFSFIISLPGCSDCAQLFKDHAIDGETLPLLTEEHLLDTMGLKLGPALKIRSQVQWLNTIKFQTPSDMTSPVHCNSSGDTLGSPCSLDPETSKTVEQLVSEGRENPCDTAGAQADFQMVSFQKS